MLGESFDDLGPAEVLRKVVDLDHVLAQRFLPLPERVFLGRDDSRISCRRDEVDARPRDRKSTRLNSSHSQISYAVFCLKKKVHGRDSLVDILKERGLLSESDAV